MKTAIEEFKENIEIWVEALRSGKYGQTQYTLQDNNGYCCLGVACELFIPKERRQLTNQNYLKGELPTEQGAAPQWLKEVEDDLFGPDSRLLTELNDNDAKSFNEIAALLEEKYLLA